MEPYPTEMRKRILADCDAGMGTQAVALKYLVSESWVSAFETTTPRKR